MKLSHIFKELLNEDFKSQTQKFISQGYEPEIVRSYIEKFKYIRDGKYREAINPDLKINVPVEKRFDIDAYPTFNSLETLVDYVSGQRPVKTTMSKQNDIEVTGEAVYNKGGIEVYYADNPRACIKYKGSMPYSWCVARSDSSNMFYTYRFKPYEPAFYFVKDVDATQKELADIAKRGSVSGGFANKYHFFVIQVPKNLNPEDNETPQYIVTSANNDGDTQMSWNQIVKINPKLAAIKEVLKPKPFTPEERTKHERFKKGLNDNDFKKLSYEDKKSYLDIYPTIAKPITTSQFLSLPEDLKNLYVSFGIGLNDEQFADIKNNPKLIKRYTQISDRKLDAYLKADNYSRRGLKIKYTELIVLPDNRITEYLNSLNKKQIGNFIAVNGADKLEMLEKHASGKLVSNYSEIKPIIDGLKQSAEHRYKEDDGTIEQLNEMLPDSVSVTYGRYSDEITFELSSEVKFHHDLEDLMSTLNHNSWSSWNDSYFEGWNEGLDEEYTSLIERALSDQQLVAALRKNGVNPTPAIVESLLDKFKVSKSIKEYIDETFSEAQNESENRVFGEIKDKFDDIISYESNNRSYYGYKSSDTKEITIKIANFIGALISDADMLTKDKTNFESSFEVLLEDMMEQADLPTSYEELSEMVREGGNMDVDYDGMVERIKDELYEIIDEKIYDDEEEFGDYSSEDLESLKQNKYNILTSFEKILKDLGQDENANEIENDLVRIVFDRNKIKPNGSIYTTVVHKGDNKTYNGFMALKDIPTYFKNYKLFEEIKRIKKFIK
jgi:hypothetical protein